MVNPPRMLSFLEVVKPDLEAVNRLIIAELGSEVQLIEEIGHYLINAGGKRLRPVVALLAARCAGEPGDRHIALAAIIELIHTATLLHDDVVDTPNSAAAAPPPTMSTAMPPASWWAISCIRGRFSCWCASATCR